MRLYELQTLKQFVPPMMQSNLPKYMMSHGFECLGMGVYGSVYKSEKYGNVVKLFSRADLGYQAFLKFALSKKGNANLPVFRGRFKQINEKYMACRMEPLDPLPEAQKQIFNDNHAWMRYTKKPIQRSTLVESFQVDDQISDDFIDLLMQLDAARIASNTSWDLHGNNVMRRGNVPVIIDAFI